MSDADYHRPTDWDKDGVGMAPDGFLVIRDRAGENFTTQAALPSTWYEVMAKQQALEDKIVETQLDINAREPHRFLPDVIAELDKRGAEAEALRGDGVAGKVMWGQAQAYRDALALVKSFFR